MTSNERVFRSGRTDARGVVKRYIIEPSLKAWTVEIGDNREPTDKAAYALAMANQHKSWAKRWLRVRRYTA